MAKQKPRNKVTRQQLRKIWKRLGYQNWLDILNTHKRNHNFVPAGQGILKGLCINPEHDDSVPSFFLNVEKGFVKCYGCDTYTSNPLTVLSWILDLPDSEALQQIQDKYGINFLPTKALAELEEQRLNSKIKEEIYQTTHQMMCDGIADPTKNENAFAVKGVDWLVNDRKIPKDTLHLLPIGVMPELARLQGAVFDRYNVKKAAWQNGPQDKPEPVDLTTPVFNYLKDYIKGSTFIGGILFPLHANIREIGRIKLRAARSKEFLFIDDPFEDSLGLFGLGWEQYKIFQDAKSKVDFIYLLEGEIDALSLMSRFMQQHGKALYPVVSVGGKSGAPYIEPALSASGISRGFMVGDSLAAKGEGVVEEWMKQVTDLHVRIFNGWDKLQSTDDIDEAVIMLGEKAVTKVLYNKFDDNFTTPSQWAYTRADREMAAIDEHDYRALMETAANHGTYLNNKIECEHYAEQIATAYNINSDILKREISTRENTEDGFILRCTDALKSILFPVSTDLVRGQRILILYDKVRKRFNNIRLDSPQSLSQELAPIVGTLYDFVNDKVGYPTFLQMPGEDGLVRESVDKKLKFYLKEAVQNMAQGSPDALTTFKYKQGYHVINTPNLEQREYIVCGPDVIRLDRTEKDVTYTELEGPSDEGVLFDIGFKSMVRTPWYPRGMTTDVLNRHKNTDLRNLYETLYTLYSSAFNFKHHEVTSKLLASLMMVLPIMDVFERPLLMFITGDTHSGKSHLAATFAGVSYKKMQILYAGHGTEDFTAASVASMADSSSLVICIDEFESSDPTKCDNARRIFEMFRSLIGGATTRTRGRPDGSYYETPLKCPVIFSAIQGAERPQDLNRMLHIEMHKIEGKMSPLNVLHKEIGIDKLRKLRQGVNLGMYPHALELAQLEQDIIGNFQELQAELPFDVEWRMASSLFSPLAVMRHIGLDWKGFFKEYVQTNEALITRASTISESETYLNAMLRHAAIHQRDLPPVSVAQLLNSPERRPEINTASCGVYYDEQGQLLLFLLDQAVPKLLPYHMKYPGLSTIRMKETLDRHKAALNPQEVLKSGILRRVGPHLGAGIHLQDVVVLRAKAWLDSAEESMQAAMEDAEEAREEDVSDAPGNNLNYDFPEEA